MCYFFIWGSYKFMGVSGEVMIEVLIELWLEIYGSIVEFECVEFNGLFYVFQCLL